jgi:hypothetical protein
MKLQEVTSYNLLTESILNEGWQDLTESQRLYLGRWEKELWPLIEQYTKLAEAELTPAQIQAIFQGAEETAMSSGNNKTALGKAGSAAAGAVKMTADMAKKVNAKIDELGRLAQQAGPIQNMDAKFEKLKADIKSKNSDSKVVQGIEKVSGWAKDNPGKASIAVGILTAIAAFAGGPAGGAAAGLILRASKDLLRGEKLSTAAGKSLKTAAVGAAIGFVSDAIGDAISVSDAGEGVQTVSADVNSSDLADASSGGAEEVASSLADMTVEEYKLQYAEELAKQFKGMSPEMVQKIADNVQINGNFPDNFSAGFDGTVVRGNIYLSPDEMAKWKEFVNPSDPFAPNGVLGSETQKWLEQNVEGVSSGGGANVVPDGGTDPETGANEPETGMKPGEGFTTDSGATYSKEDIQNLVKQAAEKGEVPDIDSLVNSKDIDAGSYADDVSSIEAELRELGIDPLKVPNEDALKAVGVEDTAADAASDAGTSAKDDPDFAPGQKPDDFDSLDPADKADALLDVPPGQWTADDYQLMKDEGMLTLQDTQTYYANNLGDIPAEARSSSVEMKKFLSAELGDEFENANAMQRSKVVKFLMQRAKVADSVDYSKNDLVALYDSLTMEQKLELFIAEGPVLDKLKGAAGKAGAAAKGAASKAGAAIKQAGKDVGNKVTANKLMKTWSSMGKPTDAGSIANILADAGLDNTQINSIGQKAGVEEPLTPSTPKTEPNANDANGDGKDDKTGKPVAKSAAAASSGIKAGTPVAFASKSGKVVQAKVVGPSEDGDPNKVSINSGKQSYNISKDKLLDPKTNKPMAKGASAAPAAGGVDLKTLASEIKKAGVAAQVKALLV